MRVQGIRGAITVEYNTAEAIIQATTDLLEEIVQSNAIESDDIASIFFSTSPDLNAEFPAVAARRLGLTNVALFCSQEIGVPGSLPMCVRILLHVNTDKRAKEITHIYLGGARDLRPDRAPS